MTGYDGFKKILGTKIHVAAEQNGLPISIVCSTANEHDSRKFIDTMENISELVDNDTMNQIATVYADKGYDARHIRNLKSFRWMLHSIQEKFIVPENRQNIYKTRFVVERFFAWLKCGFRRTAIRYEKNCENYPGLVYLASIMMCWRVLG